MLLLFIPWIMSPYPFAVLVTLMWVCACKVYSCMSLYYALKSVNKSNFPSLQSDLTDQNYDLFYCSLMFAFKPPPFLSITVLASV